MSDDFIRPKEHRDALDCKCSASESADVLGAPLDSHLTHAIDLSVIATQLGRELIGKLVAVPRRCSYGQPQVAATYPVMWEAVDGASNAKRTPKPFPTVYWLTCPHMREVISSFESQGMISEVRERIDHDIDLRRANELANVRHACKRMALISDDDLKCLEREAPNILRVIRETGIGGVASPSGVKCLHMHIADLMAGNSNPIGDMIMSRMIQTGVGTECDCGRCVPTRVAAINAGSNSAKVLVADVVPRPRECSDTLQVPWVFWVAVDTRITGLGQRLGDTGRLSETGRAVTVEAIGDFVELGRKLGADKIWATATAAARAADDSEAFVNQVQEECGIRLDIVSPELEAKLSFLGVLAAAGEGKATDGSAVVPIVHDPRSVLVVDSGGMSTEFMRLDPHTGLVASMSIPVGAVSLTDQFLISDPPSRGEIDAMREYVRTCFEGARAFVQGSSKGGANGEEGDAGNVIPGTVVAVGGSAVTLASIGLQLDAFEPNRVHGGLLCKDEAEAIFAELCSLTHSERMRVRGMIEPKRARVMPAGTAIILDVMDLVGVDEVMVSVAGILDGMAARIGVG